MLRFDRGRRFLLGGACLGLMLLVAAAPRPGRKPGRVLHVAPRGDDAHAGTTSAPWRTVAKAAREARAGDTVMLHAGTYREPLAPARGGTGEDARITFKAAPGGAVVLDGGTERLTGWTLESGTPGVNAIYRRACPQHVFGVFQDDYEKTAGHAGLWDMGSYNQYDSNPKRELHEFDASHDLYGADKQHKHDGASQYKLADGVLRVRTIDARSPDDHDVRAALIEHGLVLNRKPYVTVEGIQFRRFKNWTAIDDSPHTRLDQCDFRFAAWTGMWLTRSHDSEIRGCRFHGGGSWAGHYEDTMQITDSDRVQFISNEVAYGGHGNLFLRGGKDGVFLRNNFHDSGGSLVTLKYGSNGHRFEHNRFERGSTTQTARVHRSPHAALQLAGGSRNIFRDNTFVRSGYGLLISTNGEELTCANEFTRNRITGCEREGILLQGYTAEMKGRMNDNRFVDNAIFGNGGYQIRVDLPEGETTAFWGNTFRDNEVGGDVPIRCMAVQAPLDDAQRRWPGTFQANRRQGAGSPESSVK